MARKKVDFASREGDDAKGDEGGRKQPPWHKKGRKGKSARGKGRKK